MGITSQDKISNKLSKQVNGIYLCLDEIKPSTASNNGRASVKSQGSIKTGPDVWVKKWVDYSSKYGLGYLLSNNATGVFFNDSTKIILDPKGHNFDYMERRAADK
jgi:hypothetical protein